VVRHIVPSRNPPFPSAHRASRRQIDCSRTSPSARTALTLHDRLLHLNPHVTLIPAQGDPPRCTSQCKRRWTPTQAISDFIFNTTRVAHRSPLRRIPAPVHMFQGMPSIGMLQSEYGPSNIPVHLHLYLNTTVTHEALMAIAVSFAFSLYPPCIY
jgi:hypothetical protein